MNTQSHKSYTVTLVLAILLGWAGIHRFYVGKVGTGILYFLTFGFLGIGWIIDVIVVATGSFTDKAGGWIKATTTAQPVMTSTLHADQSAGSVAGAPVSNPAMGSPEVSASAQGAPSPVGQQSPSADKPWYTRWWAITIAVILGLGLISSIFGGGDNSPTADDRDSSVEQVTEPDASEDSDAGTSRQVEPEPAPAPEPEPEPERPDETIGQANARESAESYLSFSGFSREGLIDQLEFEGFSTDDATYAVDAVGADWNEQALRSAQSYLDFSAFSRTGLIDQLEFEGFTTDEATYGVDAVGADWNEQAALSAQSYLEFSSFSRQGLIDQLIFEGFTAAEAEYGVTQVGY